jgi:hypothetical protein
MLWDYLRTLIMIRLTLQPPCMCAGCQRGRRASESLSITAANRQIHRRATQ